MNNGGYPSVKFIMAAIQEQDASPILDALRGRKFGVTQFTHPGGSWRQGNVTLLIGVAEHQVEEVVDLLREQCHRRHGLQLAPAPAKGGHIAPSGWHKAEVGGVGVFVLSIERFEQL